MSCRRPLGSSGHPHPTPEQHKPNTWSANQSEGDKQRVGVSQGFWELLKSLGSTHPPLMPCASPPRLCAVFENSSKIVIVMEYASKGDLYDYISERQRLSEQEARHFFRQVVSAVYYCHKVRGGRVPAGGGLSGQGSSPGLGTAASEVLELWQGCSARGWGVGAARPPFLGSGVNPAPYLQGVEALGKCPSSVLGRLSLAERLLCRRAD